ncbi:MAG: alpha/beta hydrolase [Anaerolineae bacterium]|nr:alpha/beta hydrolase [Anaerolineae bacterium]
MTSTFLDPKIAKLYESVPAAELEKLHRFRAQYPCQSVMIDGVTWRYIDNGEGDIPLLVLSGALAIAEISWPTITRLAQHYRVIAPDYSPVPTMDGLVDGLAGILDHVGVERAHVMGGSYGGMVAQAFVRRYPERSISLVASHTLYPDPALGQTLRKTLRFLRFLPAFALRSLLSRRLIGGLIEEGRPELVLLKAHSLEIVKYRLAKKDFMAIFRRTIDWSEKPYTPDDLKDWPGRVLLVLSADDPATPEPTRERLKSLYPGAQVHLFEGTGHASAVLRQDEYIGVMREFIDASDAALREA